MGDHADLRSPRLQSGCLVVRNGKIFPVTAIMHCCSVIPSVECTRSIHAMVWVLSTSPVICRWTVFQRRKDGSENFFRVWDDYKARFGELFGEYWLGLDKIHRLTATSVTLRVDLAAPDNSKAYAKYEDFTIGSEKSMYVIYFGRYMGTAGDSLSFHKGMKFSTKDKDNDISSNVCARLWKGAWWYKDCHESNLNGEYRYGKHGGDTVVWHGNGGFKQTLSLQKTEMKLK